MIKLSARWAKNLGSQPESGMGYQIAAMLLRDGRRFEKVAIIGGTTASVDGYPEVPFDEPDIENISVTH